MSKPKRPVYLGIDTSCYSTSLALVDEDSNLLFEKRKLLEVETGAKGLRQSQAFFYHNKNLPVLINELQQSLSITLRERLAGIAVSEKPCQRDDSYMPVFLAGTSLGQSLAAAFDVPLIYTSHQEGHLMAALWSAQLQPHFPFYGFHLSGGTTDLILVEGLEYKPNLSFNYRVVLSSGDIPAGQLVDRVGVALGLGFPAGPALERLAGTLGPNTLPENPIPTHCRGDKISFSGAETFAKRLIDTGVAPAQVARSIEHCIANTLEKAINAQTNPEQDDPCQSKEIIFMGGVGGNQYIQQRLIDSLRKKRKSIHCYFAESKYSSDNAVGVALIGAASCHNFK